MVALGCKIQARQWQQVDCFCFKWQLGSMLDHQRYGDSKLSEMMPADSHQSAGCTQKPLLVMYHGT